MISQCIMGRSLMYRPSRMTSHDPNSALTEVNEDLSLDEICARLVHVSIVWSQWWWQVQGVYKQNSVQVIINYCSVIMIHILRDLINHSVCFGHFLFLLFSCQKYHMICHCKLKFGCYCDVNMIICDEYMTVCFVCPSSISSFVC